MNFLSDLITYVRRLVKSPSNAQLSDNLIIDYLNRFWIMDVDARMQLYDLKTKYQFETIPGLDQYNMPVYSVQTEPGAQTIASYPVYQGFFEPVYANGIQMGFHTLRETFNQIWPNYLQPVQPVAVGDGTTTTFEFRLPYFPALPGHVDMAGIIQSGASSDPIFANNFTLNSEGFINIPTTSIYPQVFLTFVNANGSITTLTDSGLFLQSATSNQLYGLLCQSGTPPFGNLPLGGGYSMTQNTVNYKTGIVNVTFPTPPPAQVPIQAQCAFFQPGIPRSMLWWNNTAVIRPVPDKQYLIEMDAYLTPAAFLSTSAALPFAYMGEYLARGAARKILADTGDMDQFNFYEPLFREQEILVWKRSQRQFTSTRTPTIYSQLPGQSTYNNAQGIT